MKKNKIKICEIFKSIIGEGRYQGYPALFVRVSGCTRSCNWCDTKYHSEGKMYSANDLSAIISAKLSLSVLDTVVFTGGECLIYKSQLTAIVMSIKKSMFFRTIKFFIESNGDLIKTSRQVTKLFRLFDYICVSPKAVEVAKRMTRLFDKYPRDRYDIKVVTDLEEVGVDLIPYATMLQPLTTYNKKRDLKIKQRVWEYCVQHGLFYSGRLHVEVWGKKKGV